MRRYITTLMLACCIGGYGQEKKQATFVPPFDFPLTLSGNFGEIFVFTNWKLYLCTGNQASRLIKAASESGQSQ